MSFPTNYKARSLTSTAARAQNQSATQPSLPTRQPSQTGATCPRPSHTQSAPNLPTNASNAPRLPTQRSQQLNASAGGPSAPIGAAEQPDADYITRYHNARIPHNPNRPPPQTYQRQYEFPPFPPLTQHPVLPFLTTAFSNQPEPQRAPSAPAKSRPTIAPRPSATPRHVHSSISTIPTMDVSKTDTTAIFIRPPLVVPPPRNDDTNISPSSLDGIPADGEPAPGTPLTYAILQTHRNWFLDADDFRKDNPNRIEYPHDLEPPRGWAPLSECTGPGAANRWASKKKERTNGVRTKGSYTHADTALTDATEYGPSDDCHEKTILRCTFCRREYHGPNAKSMWRRHVFDKHKVAMKNRREGSAGMAPKPKKGKPKAALSQDGLTLDLTNEENIIRLLERVVSGNLDINLPASLLNASSSDNVAPALNFETIAFALQKSGISLAIEGSTPSNARLVPSFFSVDGHSTDPHQPEEKTDADFRSEGEQRQDCEGRATASMRSTSESSLGVSVSEETSPSHAGPSSAVVNDVANAIWATELEPSFSKTSPPAFQSLAGSSSSLKRKAEEGSEVSLAPCNFDRAPLKDYTTIDRNNHNSSSRPVPSTPRKDKGKQNVLPSTPDGAPEMSQDYSKSSPSPRNPWTPLQHHSMTALRSRALATTGEESYLTLVLSSPATTSPIRGAGRVSFTSPFHRRTSHMKDRDRDCLPTGDDALGNRSPSSPRYPFEFNIEGINNSSYLSEFEPIPLELGSSPACWTPPSLGPPAPVSESTSRSISRASSVREGTEIDDKGEECDQGELQYPEWSSPEERLQYRRSQMSESPACDDDFDMEAFVDLADAEPASDDVTMSPHKIVAGRGLQFSKEFGLLSPEEVQRITASARSTFGQEARSSKRQRVDGGS